MIKDNAPTIEEVDEIISAKKYIIENGNVLSKFRIKQSPSLDLRITLQTECKKYMLLWRAVGGRKNLLKMSLHLQGQKENIGLLRIDYRGSHMNPQTAPPNLPDRFTPYIGEFFPATSSHVHYYVPGGKNSLEWAIPIENTAVSCKEILSLHESVGDAIGSFSAYINIETQIQFDRMLI